MSFHLECKIKDIDVRWITVRTRETREQIENALADILEADKNNSLQFEYKITEDEDDEVPS